MRNALQLTIVALGAAASIATSKIGNAVIETEPPDGETAVPADVRPTLRLIEPIDVAEGDLRLIDEAGGGEIAGTLQRQDEVVTFVPAAPLAPGDYLLVPSEGLRNELGFAGISFSTLSDPRIRLARFETAGRRHVLVSFSQDMDPATLTADTITTWTGDQQIPAQPFYLGGELHELEATLQAPEDANRVVTLKIAAGVLAADGTPMQGLPMELRVDGF